MIVTRAPGKLFLAGEYAVVTPGEPAILVAVDRYIHVRLSTEAGNKPQVKPSPHVRAAMHVVDELRKELGLPDRDFSLHIISELEHADGRKFGLGSSAAVTVAVIEALVTNLGMSLTQTDRFRLALLATIAVTPRASGGDLAAASFGGWIHYTSPDRALLATTRAQHGVTAALHSDAWHSCTIEHLAEPEALTLLAAWTGSPASTAALVSQSTTGMSAELPHTFLAHSRRCVQELSKTLAAQPTAALRALREARCLLRELGETRGIPIETPQLAALCDAAERHGAAAKPSGAGGGDCGIALAPRTSTIEDILREWKSQGIEPLAMQVTAPRGDTEGVQQ